MPTRRYKRTDGAEATHVVAIGLTVWSDGTYTGSISSWEPGGERMRHYPVLKGSLDGSVVPLGIEAVIASGQQVLDLWGEGKLR